jgi:hypothetical protein
LKKQTFLFISFGLLALFFAWRVIDYLEFLIRDPSNAIVHNNWIGLILDAVYFAVAYSLVFVKGWRKTPPAEETWPPTRCYGLLLWTLLNIRFPLCGPESVRVHVALCITIDILFLIRMILGRMRKENGWIWQTYAVAYVWLEFAFPSLAIVLLF